MDTFQSVIFVSIQKIQQQQIYHWMVNNVIQCISYHWMVNNVIQCISYHWMVNSPRKGQRYTLLLDGGLIKGWGSKDSWLLIVCHDYKIISWHTKGCPPV